MLRHFQGRRSGPKLLCFEKFCEAMGLIDKKEVERAVAANCRDMTQLISDRCWVPTCMQALHAKDQLSQRTGVKVLDAQAPQNIKRHC